jgi:hypothetical protein
MIYVHVPIYNFMHVVVVVFWEGCHFFEVFSPSNILILTSLVSWLDV